jgi:hypothetical protein
MNRDQELSKSVSGWQVIRQGGQVILGHGVSNPGWDFAFMCSPLISNAKVIIADVGPDITENTRPRWSLSTSKGTINGQRSMMIKRNEDTEETTFVASISMADIRSLLKSENRDLMISVQDETKYTASLVGIEEILPYFYKNCPS